MKFIQNLACKQISMPDILPYFLFKSTKCTLNFFSKMQAIVQENVYFCKITQDVHQTVKAYLKQTTNIFATFN